MFVSQEVKSKKPNQKPSPVPVQKVFKRIFTDFKPSAPGKKTSLFSHLNFSSVSDSNFARSSRPGSPQKFWKPRAIDRSGSAVHQSEEHGVDLGLNLNCPSSKVQTPNRSFLEAVIKWKVNDKIS